MKRLLLGAALALTALPAYAAPPFPIWSEHWCESQGPLVAPGCVKSEQQAYAMDRLMWQRLPAAALTEAVDRVNKIYPAGVMVQQPYGMLQSILSPAMAQYTQQRDQVEYRKFHY